MTVVDSLAALVDALDPPRVALVYVPHGGPTEEVVAELGERFEEGDVVVDGGNTHWDHSIRRHRQLGERGIRFLDAGTSGGVSGARHGACFMVGGEAEAYEVVAARGPRSHRGCAANRRTGHGALRQERAQHDRVRDGPGNR